MIQTIVRKFGGLVDIQGWAPGRILARKADNTGFEWIAPPVATVNGVSPDANGNISISSSTTTYNNPQYPTVEAALNKLLYVAPSITSFVSSVGTVEIGSTVTSVNLSWALNKAMTTLTLTDATLQLTDTNHLFTGLNLTDNKTYTLSASDGTNTVNSSRTISFSHKRYWGASSLATLTDADILTFNSEFSGSRPKSITYNCSGGKYFYYCYPQAWGLPSSVTVGGLSFSAYTASSQMFTNASGNTSNFYVLRCNSLQNGSNIQVVWG